MGFSRPPPPGKPNVLYGWPPTNILKDLQTCPETTLKRRYQSAQARNDFFVERRKMSVMIIRSRDGNRKREESHFLPDFQSKDLASSYVFMFCF